MGVFQQPDKDFISYLLILVNEKPTGPTGNNLQKNVKISKMFVINHWRRITVDDGMLEFLRDYFAEPMRESTQTVTPQLRCKIYVGHSSRRSIRSFLTFQKAGSLRVWGTKGECSEWLWQGIGVAVILGKVVPAAETLRVSGPTSGTSNRLVI